MFLLSVLYQNGLWISVLMFLISLALLRFFILKVIRVVKQARILSVPLLEQQDIEFAEAGRVVLCLEGPRFSRRFANLHYELCAYGGVNIKGRTKRFHARTSGLRKARMELKSYEIPWPGPYSLRIQGLETGLTADADHRIVFMRPHLVPTITCVLGILLSGWLFIGSIVLFLLRVIVNGADT